MMHTTRPRLQVELLSWRSVLLLAINGSYKTMNQVFELAGDLVPAKVAHDLMRLLAKGFGEDEEVDSLMRSSAVESYFKVLGEPKLPSILLQESMEQPMVPIQQMKLLSSCAM